MLGFSWPKDIGRKRERKRERVRESERENERERRKGGDCAVLDSLEK